MCRVDYAFSEVQWRTAALSFLSGVHLMLMQCTVVSCMKKKKKSCFLDPITRKQATPRPALRWV